MKTYNESYIGQIQSKFGANMVMVPGVRVIVRDASGKILLIRYSDTGEWGIPEGSIELYESVIDAARREVFELTGLSVGLLKPFAFYSEPRYQMEFAEGETLQQFTMAFFTEDFSGELLKESDEISDIGFYFFNSLPELGPSCVETVQDLFRYEGSIILK